MSELATGTRSGTLRSGDLWTGLAVATIGVVGLLGSLAISAPPGLDGLLGPRAYPLTVSALLVLLGVLLVVRALRAPVPARVGFGRRSTVAVVIAVLACFALLFPVLGFLLTAFGMLAVLYWYLGERRPWLVLLVAALTSAAIYVGFRDGLGVALPPTPFGF